MRDIRNLVQSISAGGSAAHAYIIEGPKGRSRDSFLQEITEGLGVMEVDFVRMQQSGKNGYVTDDATDFIRRLSMRPYGPCIAGIIDDAELMSETVQNKLLKTLEEPQPGAVLLLAVARSDALLSTVRSRCSLVRMSEYEDYSHIAEEAPGGDLMEGAFMLLTQRSPFHEFRDFLDKHIKTSEDALLLISIAEDKLAGAMREGKAIDFCASRIEMAENATADIARGMDKNKALKRLYLDYSDHTLFKS